MARLRLFPRQGKRMKQEVSSPESSRGKASRLSIIFGDMRAENAQIPQAQPEESGLSA